MKLSSERQGDFLILGQSMLWGLFPVITILSYHTLSPLISLAFSSLFAALFFAAIITRRKKWYELGSRTAIKNILLATFINGILYYLLFFFGLKFTTPGNASIVALTEVLFSFLFFSVLRKEIIPKYHIIGALLMICGAIIVLLPNLKTFQLGDILILLASSIAPFGNFFAQKARRTVTSETIMLFRSVISAGVILLFALFIQTPIEIKAIQDSLFFLLINGVLLLGLTKLFWIDGIHRIGVPKANALGSITPLFTLLFALLILNQLPTIWQLLSLVPISAGVTLLSRKKPKPAQSIIPH